MNHLAIFFRHLTVELISLCFQVETKRDEELEWVASAIASRILTSVHHQDPDFPAEIILEDLDFEDRRESEQVVATSSMQWCAWRRRTTSTMPEHLSKSSAAGISHLLLFPSFSGCPFCLRGRKNGTGCPQTRGEMWQFVSIAQFLNMCFYFLQVNLYALWSLCVSLRPRVPG